MLTLDNYRRMKDKTNLENIADRTELSFEECKEKILKKIKEEQLKVSIAEADHQKIAKDIIDSFIREKKPHVIGYTSNNELLIESLIKDLEDHILNWGILTPLKENPKVQEIQLNGPVIFYDRGNGYEIYRDEEGNAINFRNPQESMDFLNSIMMYDEKRLKQNEPLVNARTIQGYRVSATHPSVFAAHPTEPTVTWPTATIRIPTAQSFSEEDFIKNNTFCKEMSDTIKLFARSLVPVAVVGSTGSGKSTILDFIASNFDDRHRTIFIQDPAEINKRKIVDGVMVNNAIYWEADDTADPDNHNSATVYNMIVHSLRNSPDNLCLGEIRRSSEFGAASNAAQTGHVFTTTFHAGSDIGALDRFALEMSSHRRIDIYIAREMVCEFLPIIIHIERLGDGTRKILKITEVKGYDRTKNEYIINPLFKFRIKDTVLVDGNKRITGDFVQLNNISPELEDKLLKAAIPRSDINKIKLPEGERERVIKEVRYENAKELS